MPTPSLREFAEPVPVCEQASGLVVVLETFRSSACDAIVVVSQQQYPLGVINLRQVMPYLLSPTSLDGSTQARDIEDFHKPLSQLEPSLMQPLGILPAQLSLNQFWSYLQESGTSPTNYAGVGEKVSPQLDRSPTLSDPTPICNLPSPTPSTEQWALVDGDGKFLGLLNSWLILKSLAPSLAATDRSAEQESQPANLQPLMQLLEQLPLPLSLQTTAGQVLAQNHTWRQQLGASPNWDWIGDITTNLVDAPSVELQAAGNGSTVPDPPGTRLLEPFAVGNAVKERYDLLPQKAVQHYCAIDTPYLAAAVSKRRAILSAPPMTKIQESAAVWQTSAPAIATQKQSQERFFSFVKMPLSPSVAEIGRATEAKKERNWTGSRYSSDASASYPAVVNESTVLTHRYANGERYALGAIAQSPELPPNSDLWLVMAQDTTEQQQVAKELTAKNADLVQLNRLKDEFLACISHELKTPLTAVLGLSSLLKDQTLGELNERQARYARLIYQNGRQLMKVVNDILDLTRMETGQLELTLEPVQIQFVCERAYSQARRPSEQEEESTPERRFTLEIEPGLEMVVADELRLRQMLVNLLSNALKFTDADGEIGLSVNRWEGWIAFTVWDTGIGIPPEKQHLIFEKFQQLEQPLTRRYEGAGLGLVLTQRLARLHGGDVSFISKDNEGSQFTLLLPPCPPQENDGEQENFPSPAASLSLTGEHQSRRNRLVLVVETVPRYLENLTEQLLGLGYRVVVARAGTEAIEKARRLQPCVILLNPLLPQLSGWDVLTLLKSDPQTLHIPVVVTATQAEKQQASHHKADDFLSLPVQEQALLQTLTCLADRQCLINTSSLTILHLSPASVEAHSDSSLLTSELSETLSFQHSELNYRILEADDLDQAELLARVWHPDIVLLDSAGVPDLSAFLKDFSLYTGLTSLPLVTLDHPTTEAANQVTGLSVYPCLASDNSSKIAALLQVIQVAAGMSRKPSILVMEVSAVQQESELSKVERRMSSKTFQCSSCSSPLTHGSSWLQAMIQYLQTAGFRSTLSCSWAEVYRQLQDRTVDLVLIRLKEIGDSTALMKNLTSLAQLQERPPIIVLDHRAEAEQVDKAIANESSSTAELESLLKSVATEILRGHSQSMGQLLEQINQTLTN